MKLLFTKKQKLTVFAILFILLIGFGYIQFFYLKSLNDDLSEKRTLLTSEQKQVEVLSKKKNQNEGAKAEQTNSTELQKQLPVKPLQDQLILDFQQAEEVSNSKIESMNFTDSNQNQQAADSSEADIAATQKQLVYGNSNSSNQSNNSATGSNQINSSTNSSSQQQSSSANISQKQTGTTNTNTNNQQVGTAQANAVEKITAQLSVQSPSYQDFEKFVDTIENLKRIIVVESISYTGTNEITSVTDTVKPFTYSLTVSALYYPELTDLENQLPKVEYPNPANKENPLSQFADSQTP
jgi:type IV pilus assembly protein PilO